MRLRAITISHRLRSPWPAAENIAVPLKRRLGTSWDATMGIFRRKVPSHYIPIHPDNIAKKDWIILLEAGTIVGSTTEKLRVAVATLDKKIITKFNVFLRRQ